MSGGFLKGWIALFCAVAFLFIADFFDDDAISPSVRRPPIAQPTTPRLEKGERSEATGPKLPAASSRDPLFEIETGEKGNSTGTAFTIRNDGIWLTARHVVDGCDQVGLIVAPRRAVKVSRTLSHPRADMAVLWTSRGAPAISISDEPLRVRQQGFHFGFPQSEPGQVSSRLLGRRNMRSTGRYRHTEPVVAWAEQSRSPETDTLGGLSGGPVLNEKGEIVGVTVAASKRRGRVMTTARISLDSMLALAAVRPAGHASAGLNVEPANNNFIDYGTALRRQLTVAQVICRVENGTRRLRRR